MYRCVIVDDEPLIIAGIHSMVDWNAMDCEVVKKLSNGEEAWQYIAKYTPDIVITDIKMPVMDGLQLMKKCTENKLPCVFILLTNYEEFSLAQQAIELGAVDYLVKSNITSERLCKSLEKAISIYEKDKKSSQTVMEDYEMENQTKDFFKRILFDNEWNAEEDSLMQQLGVEKRFCGIYLAIFIVFLDKNEKKKMYYAESIVQEIVFHYYKESVLFRWDEKSFGIILNTENAGKENEIREMFEKIQSVVKNYFRMESLATVSSFSDNILKLQHLVEENAECSNHYYYDSTESILFFEELKEQNIDKREFDINFLKKDIENAVVERDISALSGLLMEVKNLLLEYKPDKYQAIKACSNLYYYITILLEKKDILVDKEFCMDENMMLKLNLSVSLQEIVNWLEDFREAVCKALSEPVSKRGDRIVQRAVAYIEQNYDKKIALTEISEMLGISSGYFCGIFSQKMGMSFLDYVNWVKVKHAKQLLEEHRYMMYEIAEILGFENAYYFSRVFKKVAGMTPTEYENSINISR